MKRKGKTWRVDWHGRGCPEVGEVAVNLSGLTAHKVTSVRPVMNRSALPDGVSCRYAVGIEGIEPVPLEEASWTYRPYQRKRAKAA